MLLSLWEHEGMWREKEIHSILRGSGNTRCIGHLSRFIFPLSSYCTYGPYSNFAKKAKISGSQLWSSDQQHQYQKGALLEKQILGLNSRPIESASGVGEEVKVKRGNLYLTSPQGDTDASLKVWETTDQIKWIEDLRTQESTVLTDNQNYFTI